METIVVTGGAGFIGSNFARLVRRERPDWNVVVLDKLTYAGRRENFADLHSDPQFAFVQGDICDAEAVKQACEALGEATMIFNFAAESHVDRSLMSGQGGAGDFVQTDVFGVFVLLEEAKRRGLRFVQVSTDEVYGDVEEGYSRESDPLLPRSPYSSAKAGGELMARAYYVSHDVPVIITRGSNTFGPYQYPEKLLPLFITNAMDDQPLPMYGDGLQRRDWLWVEDHARGVLCAAENGTPGEAYNVGGGNEKTNREVIYAMLELLGKPESLVKHVTDRPGHDRRYALNCEKTHALGWKPQRTFEDYLAATVEWYRDNESWWRPIKGDAEYRAYYEKNYAGRIAQVS